MKEQLHYPPPLNTQEFKRDSLNAEGDQRHSDHQQIQKVEVVPTKCSFMEKRSERCHLNRGESRLSPHGTHASQPTQ